jgi:hypothetical protein
MQAMCAWVGDTMQMWFLVAWRAWKERVMGMRRARCWLVARVQDAPTVPLRLTFVAWRRVIQEEVGGFGATDPKRNVLP